MRGWIKQSHWVIKKISPSGFGVRQLAPFKLPIEAIYQLPLLITSHEVASYGMNMQVEATCLKKQKYMVDQAMHGNR